VQQDAAQRASLLEQAMAVGAEAAAAQEQSEQRAQVRTAAAPTSVALHPLFVLPRPLGNARAHLPKQRCVPKRAMPDQRVEVPLMLLLPPGAG
jgi:hypothetical protein